MEQIYMNIETGEVGTYDDWHYQDDDLVYVNAVDRGEVVAVTKNDNGDWVAQ